MSLSKNQFHPSSWAKGILLRGFIVLIGIFLLPGCELIESLKEKEEVSYYISSLGSLSDPELSGTYSIDGITKNSLLVIDFQGSESISYFT
ncbi:MAG: hypothetical protein EP311_07425, partial [Cytophagales bacterium]